MENLTSQEIVIGISALCVVVPALILIGRAIYKKSQKPKWDIHTIQGLEEANWTPDQIKKFLGKHAKPAKKLPKIRLK